MEPYLIFHQAGNAGNIRDDAIAISEFLTHILIKKVHLYHANSSSVYDILLLKSSQLFALWNQFEGTFVVPITLLVARFWEASGSL